MGGFGEVGVSRIELSYNLRADVAFELVHELRKADFEVLSVHHPFPFPDGDFSGKPFADPYNCISAEESERRAACELIRKSLKGAAECGAGALVLHMGNIFELSAYEKALRSRLKEGGEVESLVVDALRKRESLS